MSESSMPSADGAAVSGEPGRAAFVLIPVLGLALGAGPAAAAMSLIPQERLRIPFAATGAALGVLVTAALLAAVWYRRKARSALRAAAAAELHRDAAEDQRLEAEKRAAAV
ncbi:hypothetical protein [Nocardia farcinica]|nr:hypothetical protein [Nocardia farcinica]